MRGEKQTAAETLFWAMGLVSRSIYPAPLPEVAVEPVVIEAPAVALGTALAPPTFNMLEAPVPTSLPPATEVVPPTTTTINIAPKGMQKFKPAPDVDHLEPWIPTAPPSELELAVRDKLNPDSLTAAGLTLVDVLPTNALDQQLNAQSAEPGETVQPLPTRAVFVILTLDNEFGMAFTVKGGDESFTLTPAFGGKLPQIANPAFFDSKALFQYNNPDTIQNEALQYMQALPGDTDTMVNAIQIMRNVFYDHRRTLSEQSASSQP